MSIFLSILPILCLLCGLLIFKLSAMKASAISFLVATLIFYMNIRAEQWAWPSPWQKASAWRCL